MKQLFLLGILLFTTFFAASAQFVTMSGDVRVEPSKSLSRLYAVSEHKQIRSTASEGTNGIGYGYEYSGLYGAEGLIGAAIAIPSSQYKGKEIKQVKIAFGTCSEATFSLFISDELNDADFTEEFTVTQTEGWGEYTLSVPYRITGENLLYIGYKLRNSAETFPLGVCGQSAHTDYGSLIFVQDGWYLGRDVGVPYNIALRVIVEDAPIEDVPDGNVYPQISCSAIRTASGTVSNSGKTMDYSIGGVAYETVSNNQVAVLPGILGDLMKETSVSIHSLMTENNGVNLFYSNRRIHVRTSSEFLKENAELMIVDAGGNLLARTKVDKEEFDYPIHIAPTQTLFAALLSNGSIVRICKFINN